MTYKISWKNQLKALQFLIIGSILFVCLISIFIVKEGFSLDFVNFYLTYYLILLTPTLFLHFEYYFINKNDIFLLNTTEQTIQINKQDPILFNEIESITFIMPPVWHRKGHIRLLPFEDYHLARIQLKNGTQFTFTSLMAPRIEDELKQISGVKVLRKKRLIATNLLS